MNEKEKLCERIGFLKGTIATMELYAVYYLGEPTIGGESLKEATKPYLAEIEKLAVELSDSA